MVVHEPSTPSEHPPQYSAPRIATGALIVEEGDPCARCTNCKESFLLTVDGYHPHLLDERRNFLFADKERYGHLNGGVLYDWAPVTECPGCGKPLAETAGPTYGWGGAPVSF